MFYSFRKSRRLRRLSRQLGKPMSLSIHDLFANVDANQSAEEQLYDLIESDPDLRRVMAAHRADRDALREVYRLGLAAGLAIWVKGHWVAASALAFAPTLDFMLARGKNPSKQDLDEIWNKLYLYFHRRRIGRLQ